MRSVARSGGTYQKGQSGNPNGRPKGRVATFRAALRAELSKPNPLNPAETVYEKWAREMVAEALTYEPRLDVIKFLEGASPLIKPSDEPLEDSHATDSNGNTVVP